MLKHIRLMLLILLFAHPLLAQSTYTTYPNLEYARVGDVSLRLDLYVPNNVQTPIPLIIWIHGGGWQSGTRALGANSPQIRQVTRGYALASISYRLSGQAKFPAQIYDVKTAIRWLRANSSQYNLNTNKFAAWGGSAGGHLAALSGTSSAVNALEDTSTGNATQSSRVQAVLDWFGPTDFSTMDATALPCSVICHSCPDSPESRLIGGTYLAQKFKTRRANPIKYVFAGNQYPAFLIMHGTADCTVPPNQSELLQTALTGTGATTQLKLLAGAGHGGAQFTSPENLALVDTFFDNNLRAPNIENVDERK